MSSELTMTSISRAAFVEAMSAAASGVALVTCSIDGRPWGTTVTAFASVSADPPTVLVSLAEGTASASAIAAGGRFGLSLLRADQRELARYGSTNGATKFLDRFVERGDGDDTTPAVVGALAHLDCDVAEIVAAGDHTVFLGSVRAARSSPDALPLVYNRRGYRTLSRSSHFPTTRSA
jgi:flavin reductase ActVB